MGRSRAVTSIAAAVAGGAMTPDGRRRNNVAAGPANPVASPSARRPRATTAPRGTGANLAPPDAIDQALVLEDYEADDDTELSLITGEKLWVFKKADDWHLGCAAARTAERGWYPADFVKLLGIGSIPAAASRAPSKAAPRSAADSNISDNDNDNDGLGMSDLDALDELLNMDDGVSSGGGTPLAASSPNTAASSSATASSKDTTSSKPSKKFPKKIYYAADLYTTVALEDGDTVFKIINQLCKKFKFWEHDKCVVYAQMPSGEEKRLKPEEPLGATYGPMLEKMRLEVKNKSGVFMATTARTAESRSAAPLPPPDAIQKMGSPRSRRGRGRGRGKSRGSRTRGGGSGRARGGSVRGGSGSGGGGGRGGAGGAGGVPRKPSKPGRVAQRSPALLEKQGLLIAAAGGGSEPDVVALLREGINPNCVGGEGETPLLVAAFSGHVNIVSKLLTAGANVNYCDNRGVTALHVAALNGHPDVARALLMGGANPNAQSRKGKRPIDVAQDPRIRQLLS